MKARLVITIILTCLAPSCSAPEAGKNPDRSHIAWGIPVKGLQVGVSCDTLKIPSNRKLFFTVYLKNKTSDHLKIPAPLSFALREHPRVIDFYAQPLYPDLKFGSVTPPPILFGANGSAQNYFSGSVDSEGIDQSDVKTTAITLQPNEMKILRGIPLKSRSFRKDSDPLKGKTRVTTYWLQPLSSYRVAFLFKNDQARIGRQGLWVGEARSGEVIVDIQAAPAEHIEVDAGFELPKTAYRAGEPISITFRATNRGEKTIRFKTGSDTFAVANRHDRFSFVATDKDGNVQPDVVTDPGFIRGARAGVGLGGSETLPPGRSYATELLLGKWCSLTEPGTYAIRCRRNLFVSTDKQKGPLDYEGLWPQIPIETILTVEIVDAE